jgi:hypothetical protein
MLSSFGLDERSLTKCFAEASLIKRRPVACPTVIRIQNLNHSSVSCAVYPRKKEIYDFAVFDVFSNITKIFVIHVEEPGSMRAQ